MSCIFPSKIKRSAFKDACKNVQLTRLLVCNFCNSLNRNAKKHDHQSDTSCNENSSQSDNEDNRNSASKSNNKLGKTRARIKCRHDENNPSLDNSIDDGKWYQKKLKK